MFEMIHQFFVSIGEFFSNAWDVITNIFDEIKQFFLILKPAMTFFQTMLSTLPSVFIGFGVVMLLVLVLYIILGRTAGGD